MIVGILKEIKAEENRVCMSPGGVEFMRLQGHEILVEKNAGKARRSWSRKMRARPVDSQTRLTQKPAPKSLTRPKRFLSGPK